MKTMIPLLALVALVAFLSGCATTAIKNDQTIVQDALNKLLPDDFVGDITEISHTNAYFDVTISAMGLRKTSGQWSWNNLSYLRRSHFPLWSSTGKVSIERKLP
jgi:hypothetical protein